MLKKLTTHLIFASFFIIFLCLFGCHSQNKSASNTLRIGAISGPETELLKVAQKVALKESGVSLKIVEFSDYCLPNRALNEGDLDANLFQHQAFLTEENTYRHYQLVPIAKWFIYPMGIYSKKVSNLNQLKNKSIIAIPNDPTNEARALFLLQQAGLIRLKFGAGMTATPSDIANNPKQLRFKELDAAQLTRALPDVAAAVINTNFAVLAGLYPHPDALFMESKDSPYANILVVKAQDKNNPKFKALIEAIHSPQVVAKAKSLFHDQAVPAW